MATMFTTPISVLPPAAGLFAWWRSACLGFSTLGVLLGMGLLATLLLAWVFSRLWPGQLWRLSGHTHASQTAWLSLGLVGLAATFRWMRSDTATAAWSWGVLFLALPVLGCLLVMLFPRQRG